MRSDIKTQFRNELLQDLMNLLSEDYEKIKENMVRNQFDYSQYTMWRGYAQGLIRARDFANQLVKEQFNEHDDS